LTFCAEARRNVERWTHSFWSGKHNGFARMSDDPDTFWLDYTLNMLRAAGVEDASLDYAQAIRRAFDERYRPESYLHPEAQTVLGTLCDEGYTLGLVSNRAEELTPVAMELGLSGYFRFTLSGGQVGSWKPDARIFHRACEMADAVPSECLYVGDNFYADVVGSRAAGLVPVLLDPNDVFPDAGCVRVKSLSDLLSVIGQAESLPDLSS
jgi:HAD superfamily hydrolase (TIGR01549 family)